MILKQLSKRSDESSKHSFSKNSDDTTAWGGSHSSWLNLEQVCNRKGAIPITGRWHDKRDIWQDYKSCEKAVGAGANGEVLLIQGVTDGRYAALKSFSKQDLHPEQVQRVRDEVEIFLTLDHPHVTRLEHVYETPEHLHLVMEYLSGGELYDRLMAREFFDEETAAETAWQILLALVYLHGHQVVHRDLKLENVICDNKDSDHFKLNDFGFARNFRAGDSMSLSCGSCYYVAPEVVMGSYTEKADLWSFGVIVYTLITGVVPFNGGTSREILKKVCGPKPALKGFNKRNVSEAGRSFVRMLLVAEPACRAGAAEAIKHPWINCRTSNSELDVKIMPQMISSLQAFSMAPRLRRACLMMMTWSLPSEVRTVLRDQFMILDKDCTGVIRLHELRQVFEELGIDTKEVQILFDGLDMDQTGEITYSEFLAAVLQDYHTQLEPSILRDTFNRFDVDASGTVTVSNMAEVIGKNFEGCTPEELVREADFRGDGVISYEEFQEYLLETRLQSRGDSEKAVLDRHALYDPVVESVGDVVDEPVVQSADSFTNLWGLWSEVFSCTKGAQSLESLGLRAALKVSL